MLQIHAPMTLRWESQMEWITSLFILARPIESLESKADKGISLTITPYFLSPCFLLKNMYNCIQMRMLPIIVSHNWLTLCKIHIHRKIWAHTHEVHTHTHSFTKDTFFNFLEKYHKLQLYKICKISTSCFWKHCGVRKCGWKTEICPTCNHSDFSSFNDNNHKEFCKPHSWPQFSITSDILFNSNYNFPTCMKKYWMFLNVRT